MYEDQLNIPKPFSLLFKEQPVKYQPQTQSNDLINTKPISQNKKPLPLPITSITISDTQITNTSDEIQLLPEIAS